MSRCSDGNAGSYLFKCDTPGKHLLSCSVGKENAESAHCAAWNQKVQIQVVDYSKTAALRSTFNAAKGHNHKSYAEVAEQHFSSLISVGKFASDSAAEAAYDHLWCVEPHTDDSPHGSCSDFFTASDLAKDGGNFCKAILLADMGFVKRKRPTPDYGESEKYYMQSLALVPDNCAATSYSAGLYLMWQKDTSAAAVASRNGTVESGAL